MASREKRSLNSFRFDESDDGDAKALGRFSHRLAGLARSDQHELHRVTTTSCRSMTRSSTERIVVGRVSVCQQNHASALGRSLTGPQDPYSLPWYNSASRVPTASSDSLPPLFFTHSAGWIRAAHRVGWALSFALVLLLAQSAMWSDHVP